MLKRMKNNHFWGVAFRHITKSQHENRNLQFMNFFFHVRQSWNTWGMLPFTNSLRLPQSYKTPSRYGVQHMPQTALFKQLERKYFILHKKCLLGSWLIYKTFQQYLFSASITVMVSLPADSKMYFDVGKLL